MIMLRNFALAASVTLASAAIAVPADAQTDGAAGWSAFDRHVDADGNIALPPDFAEWMHVGSWAVVEDNLAADLHNIYIPHEIVAYFQEHQEFPDGAMMVKEVRHAKGAEHTTGRAFWAEDIIVRFIMVKDTQNRFPDNPLWGEGWGWALYEGEDETTQRATDYEADCLGCHIPAEQTDYTYVYAYPILGEDVAGHAPEEIFAAVDPEADGAEADGAGQAEAAAEMAEASALSDEERAALVERGEKVYKRCLTCHKLEAGKHGSGPSLAGVFGRDAGSVEGFAFSDAMASSGVVWNDETLDAYLADVKGFIPGNRMAKVFPGGVSKEDDRQAVIEYLRDK
ncbi:MAG: cytochrome P460 family protein [Alphaproteobacteria bacterium]